MSVIKCCITDGEQAVTATNTDISARYEIPIEKLQKSFFRETTNSTNTSMNRTATQDVIMEEATLYPSLAVVTASGHGTDDVTIIITQWKLYYHPPLGPVSRVRAVVEGISTLFIFCGRNGSLEI